MDKIRSSLSLPDFVDVGVDGADEEGAAGDVAGGGLALAHIAAQGLGPGLHGVYDVGILLPCLLCPSDAADEEGRHI